MSLFPYMKELREDMADIMSKMPKGMTRAMGINSQSFNSILGMYNSYYGIYIIVLLSIYSSSVAATIISKEVTNKTAEFLLTKPITRKNIFNTKLIVLFTLTFTSIFAQTFTAGIFAFAYEKQVNWSVFATMHTHGFLLILLFTCIGLFLSMLIKPKRSFMGMIVGIVFGSYFLNTIAKAADALSWVGYFSPFNYLDFTVTDINYQINFTEAGVVLFISLSLLIIASKIYNKKDICT